MRYHVNGQQHDERPSDRTPREPWLGYARVAREVLGGGLTINTLPDNMTHLVVSGAGAVVQQHTSVGKICTYSMSTRDSLVPVVVVEYCSLLALDKTNQC